MRLHLVDGTYELFRAHYAPRPGHLAPSGTDAKATVGIAESLLALLHNPAEAVSHIAVVFDNPIRSFRNDLFPPYKSDEGVPPELRSQFDAAERAVGSIGVTVWSMREYEADDGLASGARRFRGQVAQVRILTPDKDLGQCLQGDRVVQVDRRQRKVVNEAVLRPIAEIVHDIDPKDGEVDRSEAAGIDALINGIWTRSNDDDERLERGLAIFEDLSLLLSEIHELSEGPRLKVTRSFSWAQKADAGLVQTLTIFRHFRNRPFDDLWTQKVTDATV